MYFFFFFNDTATTEIYTLSLHDALPICACRKKTGRPSATSTISAMRTISGSRKMRAARPRIRSQPRFTPRSEEHTSELQSRQYLVCRLLLEKKKHHNILYAVFYFTEKRY